MSLLQLLLEEPPDDDKGGYGKRLGVNDQRETTIQIGISVVLGLSAFLCFCFIRTKWSSLYAARKKQLHEASPLPALPDTFFGWIPALWKVTEQQVLASAGLDAYVFLRFFKMAIKFLSVTLFFALVVIKPVHDAFPDDTKKPKNGTDSSMLQPSLRLDLRTDPPFGIQKKSSNVSLDYLYMYLVFAYLFSGLAIYLMVTETERIIGIRQEYLGSQCTVTDRTIRLSGIPSSLRSEDKIREFIEALEIGKVDSVFFCRKWKELDDLMDQRIVILRKLEESWTIFNGHRQVGRNNQSLPVSQPLPRNYVSQDEDDESGPLLNRQANGSTGDDADRPMTSLKSNFLRLGGKKIDAIDYYEEKLRVMDEKIVELRKKDFEPMPLAFVTMDSVAACQMAIQAVLNPSPMALIAKTSPAPIDVVWRNTYMPRWKRMSRGWIITLVISLLTVFWSTAILVPLATALNLNSIREIWPQLADALESHPVARSLVKTQLPTLISSLLWVIVPYLYDWLANLQGMTSQGDVELSVISKNFFFLFFNYFVIFSVLGTFSNFWEFFSHLQDSLKDTTRIAFLLATSLQKLLGFYTNLIILQGIGLYPLRLLEFGSVCLYPIYRFGCKTPRDFSELNAPPVFQYGFYMPTVMLIFIICMVYSILRESWKLILAGLIYFIIGGFVTKYHLLYAMDHRQQSTGRSWVMICNRIIIGLLLFQLTIAGQVGLKGYIKLAIGIAPLIFGTVWFSRAYSRSYDPLMKYISLGSIERRALDETESPMDPDGWGDQAQLTADLESPAHGKADESTLRFVNPSLVAPLEDVWISDQEVRESTLQNSGRSRLEATFNAAV